MLAFCLAAFSDMSGYATQCLMIWMDGGLLRAFRLSGTCALLQANETLQREVSEAADGHTAQLEQAESKVCPASHS